MFIKIINAAALGVDFIRTVLFGKNIATPLVYENEARAREMSKDTLLIDSDNALENHLKAFGHYDINTHAVYVTEKSMHVAFTRDLNLSKNDADKLTAASMGLAHYNQITGSWHERLFSYKQQFSPQDAVKLMHPHDSGFYEKGTGRFDSKRFARLKDYAVMDKDGQLVISQSAFMHCLADLAKTDTRWENANFIDKKLGEIGNSGEIDFLFKVIVSRWVNHEPVALLSDIRRFYEHTAVVLQEIKEGKIALPPKPPQGDFIDQALAKLCHASKDLVDTCPAYFGPAGARQSHLSSHAAFFQSSANTCPAQPALSTAPTIGC